jgi:hypothetical protein
VTAGGLYFSSNDTPQSSQGTITKHSVVGLVSRAVTASVFDWSIYSVDNTALIQNPTGTNNIGFSGGQVSFTGGNVLIGTTTDAGYKLDVNGTGRFSGGYLDITGADYPYLSVIGNATTTGGGIKFYGSTTQYAEIFGEYESSTNGKLIFRTRKAGDITTALTLASTGAATFSSSVTTGAPSGGTAKPFKIGAVATITPTSPNRTIEIEIDGTTYYLTAKTTND